MKTLVESIIPCVFIGPFSEGQGIRTTAKKAGKSEFLGKAAHKAAHSDPLLSNQARVDQRLRAIINAWPTLSESTRKGIVSLATSR